MLPLAKDLYLYQGSDYEQVFTLTTKNNQIFDLTGYEVNSQIKRFYNTEKIYESFSEIEDVSDGTVKIRIPNTTTSIMDAERYVYCIKATKDDIILTLVFGHILMERF